MREHLYECSYHMCTVFTVISQVKKLLNGELCNDPGSYVNFLVSLEFHTGPWSCTARCIRTHSSFLSSYFSKELHLPCVDTSLYDLDQPWCRRKPYWPWKQVLEQWTENSKVLSPEVILFGNCEFLALLDKQLEDGQTGACWEGWMTS